MPCGGTCLESLSAEARLGLLTQAQPVTRARLSYSVLNDRKPHQVPARKKDFLKSEEAGSIATKAMKLEGTLGTKVLTEVKARGRRRMGAWWSI